MESGLAGGRSYLSADAATSPSELIVRARSGDRTALDQIFARYRAYLQLTIASSMGPAMRRVYDASDVLQETLLVATRRFADFRGSDERELLIWLRALASRKLIDLARRIGRLKRAPSGQRSFNEPQPNQKQTLL